MELTRVGVTANPEAVDAALLRRVIDAFSKEYQIIVDEPLKAFTENDSEKLESIDCGLLVIVGGDGTLLWAAKRIKGNPLLLGVNTGRVGHLTESGPDDLNEILDRISGQDFFVDERARIIADQEHEALNELAVHPESPGRLLDIRVQAGKSSPLEYRADGVMVSTPTGSTGYSYSLGGPIIHADSNILLITPINSFITSQAPIIIPDHYKISVTVISGKHKARLLSDGIPVKDVQALEPVTIQKSGNTSRFIRFNENIRDEIISYSR